MSLKSIVTLWAVVIALILSYEAGLRARPLPKAAIRHIIVYRTPRPIPADPRCHGYRLNGVADVRCIPPVPER